MAKLDNRVFENAKIMFRNFGGRAGMFNEEGERSFLLFLDEAKAEEMKEEGWNVKLMKSKEEGVSPQPYISVSVEFDKGRPPRIVVITAISGNRTEITKDDTEVLQMLDFVTITNIDLILNPYEWTVRENKGIKAYLKTAYITIYEDELDLKYAQDPTMQKPGTDQSSTVNDDVEDVEDAA